MSSKPLRLPEEEQHWPLQGAPKTDFAPQTIWARRMSAYVDVICRTESTKDESPWARLSDIAGMIRAASSISSTGLDVVESADRMQLGKALEHQRAATDARMKPRTESAVEGERAGVAVCLVIGLIDISTTRAIGE